MRQQGICDVHQPYVNYVFPRSTAECSAVSLCRRRYGRRYRRRGRRLPIIIDRAQRIYLEQVSKIWVLSADSDHPSRSSRRRRHCRLRWLVSNDGGSVFSVLVIVGGAWFTGEKDKGNRVIRPWIPDGFSAFSVTWTSFRRPSIKA